MNKDLGKTSIGLEPNVAAALGYIAWFVTGIILILIEKDNKFVRFHAMQSIITFGAIFVLQMALVFTIFLVFLVPVLNVGALILWIVLMVKAYQGEKFKLPGIGNIAEQKI